MVILRLFTRDQSHFSRSKTFDYCFQRKQWRFMITYKDNHLLFKTDTDSIMITDELSWPSLYDDY